MTLHLDRLAGLAAGTLVLPAGGSAETPVAGASIDSRTVKPGQLFVPLPGTRADGHQFLDAAFARGAAAALCAREAHAAWRGREPGPLVVVEDVTAALQCLARGLRDTWTGWLLGLTGSVGKTTTKELVAAVLETAGPTLRTEGNRNNHWGVPLTLLDLRQEHGAAVVEMAMNAAGEIAALAGIARPDAALVTGAGSAHLGGAGLGTTEAIAREKASIARDLPAGATVFAADAPHLLAALRPFDRHLVTYGFSPEAAVRPAEMESLGVEGTRFRVAGFPPIHLRLVGRHQVANALGALAVARARGLDPAAVAAALEAARPLGARMDVRRLRGAVVLVDCYNANPDSAAAALETLAACAATRRIAVLGDMLELGPAAAALHRETGARVRDAELWTVGEHAADYAAGAGTTGTPVRVFTDIAAVRAALHEALGPAVIVLLKASRGAELERAIAGLEDPA